MVKFNEICWAWALANGLLFLVNENSHVRKDRVHRSGISFLQMNTIKVNTDQIVNYLKLIWEQAGSEMLCRMLTSMLYVETLDTHFK